MADDKPERVCMVAEGRKKIHSTWKDGREMVEEFDAKTAELVLRKTRKPTVMGGEGKWEFEVGAPPKDFNPSSDLLAPSCENPIFCRKDTKEEFQWRIRNLPYDKSVFSVTVDHQTQQIVVRTSIKKYFKRIDIPDMARLKLQLEDGRMTWKHEFNTLIISYTKPPQVLQFELATRAEAERNALKFNIPTGGQQLMNN
eukprot:GDKI01044286.1.p1 GENE.GDKI01044286.1~~GDKI01044286.1.p1  ORF type:complete len:198 (-),score=51.11 GDKI01044286.1:26-619(-)